MEVPMLIGPAARRAGICPRLSDGLKPLGLHNGQQLERWSARPLRAALPLADQLWPHVEIMREHTLADARAVALSIRPMRCNPAAVSWMAADKRLRYLVELAFFLIIARYLPQFHLRQRGCNLLVAVTQITSVAKVDARIAAWKALCRG